MTKTFINASFHFEITELQPTSGADLVIYGCFPLFKCSQPNQALNAGQRLGR